MCATIGSLSLSSSLSNVRCKSAFEKMRFYMWKKNRRFFFKESLRTQKEGAFFESRAKGMFSSKSGRERDRDEESKVQQQKKTKKKKDS